MGMLRKLGATVTAVAFVGVGALTVGTTAQAATVAPKVAPKTAVAVPQKAAVKTKYIGRYHLDPRCMKGRVMCANKKTRKMVYLINGKTIYVLDARFGGSKTPTRNGQFKVYRKSKNHVSKLYKSKMPLAMFFSGGQAVHYSSDFKARGYNGASHGCLNIRDKAKLAKIYAQIKIGDKVVVYSG
ncbi:L,D-transpeptidase [Kribbella sp. NPDC056951]|uniref:L,D-TPase catalytic domain-containing protein n=1 Tax=Kribbella yunnanensis TaxID=190194 RepID=A0ABP4UKT9_9ACTN